MPLAQRPTFGPPRSARLGASLGGRPRYRPPAQAAGTNNGGSADFDTAKFATSVLGDAFTYFTAMGEAEEAARIERLNARLQGTARRDILLQSLASQQTEAATTGFMLDGSIALTQAADEAKLEREITGLNFAAELEAARLFTQARNQQLGALFNIASSAASAYTAGT